MREENPLEKLDIGIVVVRKKIEPSRELLAAPQEKTETKVFVSNQSTHKSFVESLFAIFEK